MHHYDSHLHPSSTCSSPTFHSNPSDLLVVIPLFLPKPWTGFLRRQGRWGLARLVHSCSLSSSPRPSSSRACKGLQQRGWCRMTLAGATWPPRAPAGREEPPLRCGWRRCHTAPVPRVRATDETKPYPKLRHTINNHHDVIPKLYIFLHRKLSCIHICSSQLSTEKILCWPSYSHLSLVDEVKVDGHQIKWNSFFFLHHIYLQMLLCFLDAQRPLVSHFSVHRFRYL